MKVRNALPASLVPALMIAPAVTDDVLVAKI